VQRQEAPAEEELQAKPLVQRQEAPQEEELQAKPLLQRQEAPQEEELQAKPLLQRQEAPQEEELQAKPLVQRQEAPAEEELQTKPLVQRQEAPAEEELQTKPLLQRQEAPAEEELQAKPLLQRQEAPAEEELQAKRSPQRSSTSSHNASDNLENQLTNSKGGGSPLPDEVRSFMEPRFGADFSQVRVHTDSEAIQMNQAVGAQAFTHGSHIYFGAGKSPGISDLTAHELTHVVQQTGADRGLSPEKKQVSKKDNSDRTWHDGQATPINRKPVQPIEHLATPEKTIQRFESNEHKAMGDQGSANSKGKPTQIKLSDDLTVTFGDITAMAGDYFGSVKAIEDLAKVPGDNGKKAGSIDEIKYVLYVKVRGEKRRESEFSDPVKNAVAKRYYTLAGSNVTHFTNPQVGDEKQSFEQKANEKTEVRDEHGNKVLVPVNNAGSYRENHLRAIQEAASAGKEGKPKDRALLYEAFASHFLTDAYAAGHMRTPRAAISAYWNAKVPMFWTNLKWWMAENIAQHINDNTTLIGTLGTVQVIWEQAQSTFNEVLKTKGIPDLTFGDAISGAVHDYDNETGVEADVGGKLVKLVGDGQVLDEKDRPLVAGVDTMTKAAQGVKVSLKDIEDAYAKGQAGETNPEKIAASLRLKDGLFRAEQLWPKALPDSDANQTNKSLNWKVGEVEDLFKDPRMKEAIAHFANEKASTLEAEITFKEQYKTDAMKESVLAKLQASPDDVIKTFRQIINYTPGTVAALGGVGGHDSDDNAVDYYDEAIKKGGLNTLTIEQKNKLIRDVLSGATVGKEELMLVNLLDAKPSDAPTLIKDIGWRRIWDDLSGNDCRNFVQKFGSSFWVQQGYAAKRAEVEFLADGRTNDLAQETIITILRTCSGEEVRKIDKEVGGWTGLAFDLDGKWDDEFNAMITK
jgi:hypothetical protein